MTAPEVISPDETSLDLGGGWLLVKLGAWAELRNPDGDREIESLWKFCTPKTRARFDEAEAEAKADRGPTQDDEKGGRA